MEDTSKQEFDWHITRRWRSYEGEIRSAVLRSLLLIAFYSIQLFQYLTDGDRSVDEFLFHRQITFLSAVWFFVSLFVLVSLRQKYFPSFLKFLITGLDLVCLTIAASLGSGSNSPLVTVYFVLIAMAGLRFSLPLIWFVTVGSVAAYLFLLGTTDVTWFDKNHATPLIDQWVTLGALTGSGIAMGQLIRMVRQAAEHFRLLSDVGGSDGDWSNGNITERVVNPSDKGVEQ